jgi:hypothetical protein
MFFNYETPHKRQNLCRHKKERYQWIQSDDIVYRTNTNTLSSTVIIVIMKRSGHAKNRDMLINKAYIWIETFCENRFCVWVGSVEHLSCIVLCCALCLPVSSNSFLLSTSLFFTQIHFVFFCTPLVHQNQPWLRVSPIFLEFRFFSRVFANETKWNKFDVYN